MGIAMTLVSQFVATSASYIYKNEEERELRYQHRQAFLRIERDVQSASDIVSLEGNKLTLLTDYQKVNDGTLVKHNKIIYRLQVDNNLRECVLYRKGPEKYTQYMEQPVALYFNLPSDKESGMVISYLDENLHKTELKEDVNYVRISFSSRTSKGKSIYSEKTLPLTGKKCIERKRLS